MDSVGLLAKRAMPALLAILIGLLATLSGFGPASDDWPGGAPTAVAADAAPADESDIAPYSESDVAPTSIERVGRAIRGLEWGNIAFKVGTQMRYAQPQTVELLLSPSLSRPKLERQLEGKIGPESATLQLSGRMDAQLAGEGFSIERLCPETQAVGNQCVTRWRWEVTPTQGGQRLIHLTLNAHIDVEGQDAPFVVRTFDREIHVTVTTAQVVSRFLNTNWQWLWASILVPVGALAFRVWKKRRSEPETSGGSE